MYNSVYCWVFLGFFGVVVVGVVVAHSTLSQFSGSERWLSDVGVLTNIECSLLR